MIHHVTFEMPESLVAECSVFYEALGFVPVETPHRLLRRARWLQGGEKQIHLQFANRDDQPITAPPVPMSGHVAIVIDNYDIAIGALTAAGVEVEHGAEYWGAKRCKVVDPAGNALELMAAPPGDLKSV